MKNWFSKYGLYLVFAGIYLIGVFTGYIATYGPILNAGIEIGKEMARNVSTLPKPVEPATPSPTPTESLEEQIDRLCAIDPHVAAGQLNVLDDVFIDVVVVRTENGAVCPNYGNIPEFVYFDPELGDQVLEDLETICSTNKHIEGFQISTNFQVNCTDFLDFQLPVAGTSITTNPTPYCDYKYYNQDHGGFLGYGESQRFTSFHHNGDVLTFIGEDKVIGTYEYTELILADPYEEVACSLPPPTPSP